MKLHAEFQQEISVPPSMDKYSTWGSGEDVPEGLNLRDVAYHYPLETPSATSDGISIHQWVSELTGKRLLLELLVLSKV
jgi:hypothetical protein